MIGWKSPSYSQQLVLKAAASSRSSHEISAVSRLWQGMVSSDHGIPTPRDSPRHGIPTSCARKRNGAAGSNAGGEDEDLARGIHHGMLVDKSMAHDGYLKTWITTYEFTKTLEATRHGLGTRPWSKKNQRIHMSHDFPMNHTDIYRPYSFSFWVFSFSYLPSFLCPLFQFCFWSQNFPGVPGRWREMDMHRESRAKRASKFSGRSQKRYA